MTTLEELRTSSRLPHIRCPSCGKVTGNLQDKYDRILGDKAEVYYTNVEDIMNNLILQGIDEMTAQKVADSQARRIADMTFNRRVKEELKVDRFCCMRTLASPMIQPLGESVTLSPEVDVGIRMSQVKIEDGQEKKIRVYSAR